MKTMIKHLSKLIGYFLISSVACSVVLLIFIKLGYLQAEKNQPVLEQSKFDQLVTRQWLFQKVAEQEGEISLLKAQVSRLEGLKATINKSGAWIGVQIHKVDENVPGQMDDEGIVIAGIAPEGPASKSNLVVGDIVREVDGQPIAGVEAFQNAISNQPIGKTILLSAIRDGSVLQIELTPEQWPKR